MNQKKKKIKNKMDFVFEYCKKNPGATYEQVLKAYEESQQQGK